MTLHLIMFPRLYKIEQTMQSHDKQQEVSSKKITVEANRALLALKKDRGIVKGSK